MSALRLAVGRLVAERPRPATDAAVAERPVQRQRLPDGRVIVAFFEGHDVGWVCHLEGAEHEPIGDRSLARARARVLASAPFPAREAGPDPR